MYNYPQIFDLQSNSVQYFMYALYCMYNSIDQNFEVRLEKIPGLALPKQVLTLNWIKWNVADPNW